MPEKLLTLKAAAPQFDASKGVDGLPARILIMPWGDNATAEGQVIVNETTLKTLASYNASKNWDRIALDFEHSSVPGSPTYKGEPVKVAGYGTLQTVEGEGIYLLMSSWTREGKEYAAGGHYGDLSPVVQVNAKNEVIGLHSAALCRHGATPGLIFLSATTTQTNMDNKPPQTADELFAALKTALGLGADADPAAVMAAFATKIEEATKALSAAAEAAKKKDEPDADPAVKALTATVAGLADSVKALTGKLEQNERTAILSAAAREGKEVPKTAAETMPLDQLKLLCAELPVTVPIERRTVDATTLMLSSSGGEPKEDAISKHTGVSADDRKKYAGL